MKYYKKICNSINTIYIKIKYITKIKTKYFIPYMEQKPSRILIFVCVY